MTIKDLKQKVCNKKKYPIDYDSESIKAIKTIRDIISRTAYRSNIIVCYKIKDFRINRN